MGDPVSDTPLELEVVFADGRPGRIALAESILISAGIQYAKKGEYIQDLFAYGRFPMGSNPMIGPIEILVRPEDAEDARAMLAEVGAADDGEEPESAAAEDADAPAAPLASLYRNAERMAKIVLVVALVLVVLATVGNVVLGIFR